MPPQIRVVDLAPQETLGDEVAHVAGHAGLGDDQLRGQLGRLSRGASLLLGFDPFHLVDQLMTQPLQLILAEHLDGTGFDVSGKRLWDDVPAYVDAAVDRLATFYDNNL